MMNNMHVNRKNKIIYIYYKLKKKKRKKGGVVKFEKGAF